MKRMSGNRTIENHFCFIALLSSGIGYPRKVLGANVSCPHAPNLSLARAIYSLGVSGTVMLNFTLLK